MRHAARGLPLNLQSSFLPLRCQNSFINRLQKTWPQPFMNMVSRINNFFCNFILSDSLSIFAPLRPCVRHKLLHCRLPLFSDPLPVQHLHNGHQDNLQIQPKTPVINIPHIQLKLVFPGNSIPPIHLRPSENSRLNFMTTHLLRRIAIQILHKQGPRPHNALILFKNVERFEKIHFWN